MTFIHKFIKTKANGKKRTLVVTTKIEPNMSILLKKPNTKVVCVHNKLLDDASQWWKLNPYTNKKLLSREDRDLIKQIRSEHFNNK